MPLSETERRKLINRLKTVKNAEERDRIIWALAGQEPKSDDAEPHPATSPRVTTAPGKPVPRERQNSPRIAVDTKRLVGLAVPVFFLIFGITYIIQSIVGYLATGRIETEIGRLFMGIIFVFFGLAGIFKALRTATQAPER